MSDTSTETPFRLARFLDTIPDAERRQVSGTFYRAARRVADPTRMLRLVAAWLIADEITQPEQSDRITRALDAIEAHPELALDFARNVVDQLRGVTHEDG